MGRVYIPRYSRRQLVRVSMVYIDTNEPISRALARVEEVIADQLDFQAPSYTIQLLSGQHRGETHTVPEVALE